MKTVPGATENKTEHSDQKEVNTKTETPNLLVKLTTVHAQ